MHLKHDEYLSYDDGTFEAFLCERKAVLHDKRSDKYYGLEASSLPREVIEAAEVRQSRFTIGAAALVTASTAFLLTLNMIISLHSHPFTSPRFFFYFLPYMVFSVLIHEGAHVVALKLCGKRPDRAGVKLNYLIFPAFYVRLNQTLLLPSSDRVVVHLSGIWTNLSLNLVLYIVNVALIDSPDLDSSIAFAVVALSMNALPILSSDGYRCLLAWCDVDECKDFRKNPRWVAMLKSISWVIVIVYSIRIVGNFIGGRLP